MPVRNSAKAIVLHDGKILVNRCRSRFGEYYALPGGGQRQDELLEEALLRELLEETGYSVIPRRLTAVYERISELRKVGASHKMYFIFLCSLSDEPWRQPTEQDKYQLAYEWVAVEDLKRANIFPKVIRDNLDFLVESDARPMFLGSERGK